MDDQDLMADAWAAALGEQADAEIKPAKLEEFDESAPISMEERRKLDAILDIPVTILWGKLDPVAVAVIAETLAGEIPGARLEWLDDLGHYPQLEAPERVAAAVRRWLT